MKKAKVKGMVGVALLMAMIIVLQFVSSSIPPIGGFVSISLVLIPIVMGGAVFGIKAGVILGATFGAVVLINCVTGADGGGAMVFQANPAMCAAVVLGKGILAGLLSACTYHLIKGKNAYIAMLCAAIVCPVVNTGVFIICMVLFFGEVLTIWAAGSNVVGYVLSSLVLCNFLPELLINVIFSPAGQRIVHAVK